MELLALQNKVAHDDWQVAPDGRRVVYLSGTDHALQVITLPVPEIPALPAEPEPAVPPLLEAPPLQLPAPVPVIPPEPTSP